VQRLVVVVLVVVLLWRRWPTRSFLEGFGEGALRRCRVWHCVVVVDVLVVPVNMGSK